MGPRLGPNSMAGTDADAVYEYYVRERQKWRNKYWMVGLLILIVSLTSLGYELSSASQPPYITSRHVQTPSSVTLEDTYLNGLCTSLRLTPSSSPDVYKTRDESDRYEAGTPNTLIKNATIWTGAERGTEIVYGDMILEKGVVRALGGWVPKWLEERGLDTNAIDDDKEGWETVDAQGRWVTPGLLDLNTHVGVLSLPALRGGYDVDSSWSPVTPWLRSIDAFSTHDESFRLGVAGGVTTVQALPGTTNAIGGESYMVKLRKTSNRTAFSMMVDPPYNIEHGRNLAASSAPPRWRYMYQTCTPKLSRMDRIWALRQAYKEAQQLKEMQDKFCDKTKSGAWNDDGDWPGYEKWELLVDVLRGKVKVSTECSEVVDLEDMIRLSNEFKFSIASFHGAAEAYLVPDLLNRTWGDTPTVALHATKYRDESATYRGSEFAPRVLVDNNISVVMKTGHPSIQTRYLVYEAQQAYYYGLPAGLALASVTSTPAQAAGLDHRLGILREGADADAVLWDSHPLQLGATPLKVWIDGIEQLQRSRDGDVKIGVGKDGIDWQDVPEVPNWDREMNKTLDWEGLPPLEGKKKSGKVVFTNVREVRVRSGDGGIETLYSAPLQPHSDDGSGIVVVNDGRIMCSGSSSSCPTELTSDATETIDLRNGTISPGLMSYGSPLGLEEIAEEPSTGDGSLYDPLYADSPRIMGDVSPMVRAADGLQYGTRNALLAYRSGVTVATTSLFKDTPFKGDGPIVSGLSTTFKTGSETAVEKGAIAKDVTALHVSIDKPDVLGRRPVSVSTQVAALRHLLLGGEPKQTESGFWFKKAAEGTMPLVIETHSADIMAVLLNLKAEVQEKRGTKVKWVFSGASEAHLIAQQIAKAGVGVILLPARASPDVWASRRILAGPPLSNDTALVTLLEHKVMVAIGVREAWQARSTRFELKWALLDANGRIQEDEALALASTNLEKLLGLKGLDYEMVDLIAYEGGNMFDLSSKVAAIISPGRSIVDVL